MGYRLLTRDDIFPRVNPIPSEKPLRALVFMTDGDTQANSDDAWYGAYGGLREKQISSNATNVGTFKEQVMRRFAKVCENAKRDGISVYIVSLLPAPGETQRVFRGCAGSNYLETSTQTDIQKLFARLQSIWLTCISRNEDRHAFCLEARPARSCSHGVCGASAGYDPIDHSNGGSRAYSDGADLAGRRGCHRRAKAWRGCLCLTMSGTR
jgi:hypothetical protein